MVPLEYTPVVFDWGPWPWCKTGCHTSASKRRAPRCAQLSHAFSIPTGMFSLSIPNPSSGWSWFGTFFCPIFFFGKFIIPTDELVFFRVGLNHHPVIVPSFSHHFPFGMTSIPPLLTRQAMVGARTRVCAASLKVSGGGSVVTSSPGFHEAWKEL